MVNKIDRKADRQDLRMGMISSRVFLDLCKYDGKEMNADNIKSYLLALGIAVEISDDLILIPALVSNENKVNIIFSRLDNLTYFVTDQVKPCSRL